jgi:hypothetical protein
MEQVIAMIISPQEMTQNASALCNNVNDGTSHSQGDKIIYDFCILMQVAIAHFEEPLLYLQDRVFSLMSKRY